MPQIWDINDMIEYLLLLQIPFYIIAAGVWYIAFKIKRCLDNWEIEVEERKHECDAYIDTMALLDAEAESKDKE